MGGGLLCQVRCCGFQWVCSEVVRTVIWILTGDCCLIVTPFAKSWNEGLRKVFDGWPVLLCSDKGAEFFRDVVFPVPLYLSSELRR